MRGYTEEMPHVSPVQSQKLKSDREKNKGKKRCHGINNTVFPEDHFKSLTCSKLGGLD